MPLYKKSALDTKDVVQHSDQVQKETNPIKTEYHNIESNEDVEITIKAGNTISNIVIKMKNDVQLKVNTDKEVQTSWCLQDAAKTTTTQPTPQEMETRSISININSNNDTTIEQKQIFSIMVYKEIEEPLITKKNISQNVTMARPQSSLENSSQIKNLLKPQLDQENTNSLKIPVDQEDLEYSNELDIFESDNVKETNVELLKYAKNTTLSEIIKTTAHKRNKTQKTKGKRGVDVNDENENLPSSKKQKLNNNGTREENPTADLSMQSKHVQPDGDSMNCGSILSQVCASIEADMEEIESQNVTCQKFPNNNNVSIAKDKRRSPSDLTATEKRIKQMEQKMTAAVKNEMEYMLKLNKCWNKNVVEGTQKQRDNIAGKCVFDCLLNSNDFCVIEATSAPKIDEVPIIEPQHNIRDYLTPVISRNQESANTPLVENQVMEIDNDDSESVAETPPQKAISFGNIKQKSIGASKEPYSSRIPKKTQSKLPSGNSQSGSTKVDAETPLALKKFVNHIEHNSTPLNFSSDDSGPEQTIRAKMLQEKQFMRKAFEITPFTLFANKRFCIAGSFLTANEIAKLKTLCYRQKWTYADKYTRDLTHLVVGVDEENKAQRSVKFFCAIAASKWIVNLEWVNMCLKSKSVVGEEKYEALGSSGEASPRRSRVATTKLFKGFSFYLTKSMSVLNMENLTEMLEASGGRVVSEMKQVRVTETNSAPALFLAEPEHTPQNRFTFLARKLSVVPVNDEWVLNCLESYSIGSIQKLLLCPSFLLPKATAKWAPELLARENF